MRALTAASRDEPDYAQHDVDGNVVWEGYAPEGCEGCRDIVRALDLHKDRIRRLQEILCECQHADKFQADLHDELCPVYMVAAKQREETA